MHREAVLRRRVRIWRLLDCSFGVFGAIPLYWARRATLELSARTPGIQATANL